MLSVDLYVCETSPLAMKEICKLHLFENKKPSNKFGNDELDQLIRHKNIINHIKEQRLSWFGHLQRESEEIMVEKMYTSGNRC